MAEIVLVYVQLGCSAGSLYSPAFFNSNLSATVLTLFAVFCEDPLWPVDGRNIFGLILFAFLKPADHHNSRSVEIDALELLAVLTVSIDEALVDRSLAFRSLRAPTVSASFSNGRSVANMLNHGGGDPVECSGATIIQ